MRILNKEHRCVIANEIKNPFFGVELGGKTTDITHGVSRARAALNGRKTHEHGRDFIWVGKEVGFGYVAEIFIRLEITVCGRTTRMNDTFRNALVVKMGDFFSQNKVFEQRRATIPGA
ncbi:hypothetical protein D3C80_819100 [compost metagenome]